MENIIESKKIYIQNIVEKASTASFELTEIKEGPNEIAFYFDVGTRRNYITAFFAIRELENYDVKKFKKHFTEVKKFLREKYVEHKNDEYSFDHDFKIIIGGWEEKFSDLKLY